MGYTTDFYGEVTIDPPLNPAEIAYLNDFANSCRMHRTRGPLYANPGADYGQTQGTEDVLSHGDPGPDQPGLWCQWIPNEDGTALVWDEGEKFYNAAEWMDYLTNRLLAPGARGYLDAHAHEDERLAQFTCDHQLNGRIEAQGEDTDDRWLLVVEDNHVHTKPGAIVYAKPAEVAQLATLNAALPAITTMVETLGTEEIGYEVGTHMTCGEADSFARVMRHLGHLDAAVGFLLGHSCTDDEGDSHFWDLIAERGQEEAHRQRATALANDYALAL